MKNKCEKCGHESGIVNMDEYINNRVDKFAEKMKETLKKNVLTKGKGPWDKVDLFNLEGKLDEEVNELKLACIHVRDLGKRHLTNEATDVAALAMMISDNFGVR
jgi:hypothetical protein